MRHGPHLAALLTEQRLPRQNPQLSRDTERSERSPARVALTGAATAALLVFLYPHPVTVALALAVVAVSCWRPLTTAAQALRPEASGLVPAAAVVAHPQPGARS